VNHLYLIAGISVAVLLLWLLFAARPTVSLADARAEVQAGRAILIDVREPAEWAGLVAEGALLLPFSDLRSSRLQWTPALERLRGTRLMLYCESGVRSGMAAAKLRKEGYETVNAGSLARCRCADWQMSKPENKSSNT